MSPKLTFLLALLGVLAAGLPLVRLTQVPGMTSEQPAPVEREVKESPKMVPVYATVQYTGHPVRLELLHAGESLARLPLDDGGAAEQPWEVTVQLPAPLGSPEIEVQAEWADAGVQAVTVTLEPPGLPACSVTRWTLPAGMLLFDYFAFSW